MLGSDSTRPLGDRVAINSWGGDREEEKGVEALPNTLPGDLVVPRLHPNLNVLANFGRHDSGFYPCYIKAHDEVM